MVDNSRCRQAAVASWVGLTVDCVLTIGKISAGILGNSAAMVADGAHSLSDVVTDVVAILGFRMVAQPADSSHRYGHGKFETLCSAFVGVALIGAGLGILWGAGCRIAEAFDGVMPEAPGEIALWAAGLSVIAKEILYRYTVAVALRLNSPALKANAWHDRSDALSSVGAFLGIGGAMALGGWGRLLDPVAGVAVSLIVVKVGLSIAYDAINELTEAALPEDVSRDIVLCGESVPGVRDLHRLRTRRVGAAVAMDFHLLVDPEITVREGHDIATAVEDAIRERMGRDTMISVHVEPDDG
ncbi:MAG: cation diffusion facilitator family transporter [Synergistota bacterium]|nr:cation diffusion facilitator family transporter [Synergistota bacterium]